MELGDLRWPHAHIWYLVLTVGCSSLSSSQLAYNSIDETSLGGNLRTVGEGKQKVQGFLRSELGSHTKSPLSCSVDQSNSQGRTRFTENKYHILMGCMAKSVYKKSCKQRWKDFFLAIFVIIYHIAVGG